MLDAVPTFSSITDLITVVGSAGTVLGGAVGAIVGSTTWRQAFECLALGAAAGGVGGCLAAFVVYGGIRVLG